MTNTFPLSIIILAAGKGTRMKSEKAKVLHEILFLPMIHHVIHAVTPLHPEEITVVVGHQQETVKKSLKDFFIGYAVQKEQLGTGHAVLAAESVTRQDNGTVLILYGDTPLLRNEALVNMTSRHFASGADLTLLTTLLDDPTNYGRILTDGKGNVSRIVEQKDCTAEQLEIGEINAGIYCVSKNFLFRVLKKVGTQNSQGEIYLTDIVEIAVQEGLHVEKYTTSHPLDVLGVNSRVELARAQLELQLRQNHKLMMAGVTICSPETTLISGDSSLGMDSTISGGVEISGASMVGKGCTVGQGAIIRNCVIGDNSTIAPYSCLTGSTLPEKSVIAAPFTVYYNNTSSVNKKTPSNMEMT
ncbi:MAG: bifunctional N-acetylglucosamine-1-phosphate uridyltransferase/glucosamine-1-phosphate acetyltransferase [Deltaproteobacteria bacterium]|nr:bifunctional N-acetylglucosamine-1-phosphate uridyltransferase/glucosamine-1-phosphate acetyltransferase [Deltaproteobacteria bacterium]